MVAPVQEHRAAVLLRRANHHDGGALCGRSSPWVVEPRRDAFTRPRPRDPTTTAHASWRSASDAMATVTLVPSTTGIDSTVAPSSRASSAPAEATSAAWSRSTRAAPAVISALDDLSAPAEPDAIAIASPGSHTVTMISLRPGNSPTALLTAARDSAEPS